MFVRLLNVCLNKTISMWLHLLKPSWKALLHSPNLVHEAQQLKKFTFFGGKMGLTVHVYYALNPLIAHIQFVWSVNVLESNLNTVQFPVIRYIWPCLHAIVFLLSFIFKNRTDRIGQDRLVSTWSSLNM